MLIRLRHLNLYCVHLYCELAEGKIGGSFLEAETKISLPTKRRKIAEMPEHPDPIKTMNIHSIFNRISDRQRGSRGINKVVEID